MSRFDAWVKWFVLLAAVSMYITLFLPYSGEEGTYTMSAMEMAHSHNYWMTTLYGLPYFRPPLLNWLIIPLAKLIGWQHVLIASRFVTATATILTSVTVFYFVRTITKDKSFSWLCAACFYGEAFLMRLGWLAYSDTLLTLFTFLGMCLVWYGTENKKHWPMFLAAICICLGFLAKAFTPYYFYLCIGFVLWVMHKNRKFLFHPLNLFFVILAFVFPYIFLHLTEPSGLSQMWHTLVYDERANSPDLLASWSTVPLYIKQVFLVQSVQLLVVLLPFSLLALWCFFRKNVCLISNKYQHFAKLSVLLFLIGFMPCWLSPDQWPETRYYLPVLPALSIAMAYLFYNSTQKIKNVLIGFGVFALLVKFILIPLGFYLQDFYARPHYQAVAEKIQKITRGCPVYFAGIRGASILSLVSTIDSKIMPQKVLLAQDIKGKKKYFVVEPNSMPSCQIDKRFKNTAHKKLLAIYGKERDNKRFYCLFRVTKPR